MDRLRARLGDERGAALLLALGFLVFFSLVIAAVLGFAEASVRNTTNLREQRNTVYAADGAMDGAIQYARSHPEVGAFGATPCITYTVTLNGKAASVSCASFAGATDAYRQVRFTASVDGVPRVTTEVVFDDLAGAPVPVDVLTWTYLR